MKMQFMKQIVQGNPKYQEALQGDERFQALLENYGKNLQQLDDASGIWQALKEVLDEATEMSVASAISDGVGTDDRHWRAGYAQAVTDVMGTLNRYRKV